MSETIKNQDNPLLKRAYIFLEDKSWGNAKEYFERTLDTDPENAQAYMGLLLVYMKASNVDELLEKKKFSKWSGEEIFFYEEDYFKKALKYADDEYIKEIGNLKEESIYRRAVANMEKYNSDIAILGFESILEYKDASILRCECIYKRAILFSNSSTISGLKKAIDNFEQILDYKDASEMKDKIFAEILQIKKNRKKALIIFTTVLVIFSVLFTWWAIETTPKNNLRAEFISEKLEGKRFASEWNNSNSPLKNNGLIDFFDKEDYFFLANNKVKSINWNRTKSLDLDKLYPNLNRSDIPKFSASRFAQGKVAYEYEDEIVSQNIFNYKVKVSLLGIIRLKIGGVWYTVTADEKDNPISFKRSGEVYYLEE